MRQALSLRDDKRPHESLRKSGGKLGAQAERLGLTVPEFSGFRVREIIAELLRPGGSLYAFTLASGDQTPLPIGKTIDFERITVPEQNADAFMSEANRMLEYNNVQVSRSGMSIVFGMRHTPFDTRDELGFR